MNGSAPIPIAQLRAGILRSVSRSFYLSIRLLPRPVRDPIALGYLLARATDTIADTAEIDAAVRMQHLAALADLIRRAGPPDAALPMRDSFAPRQTNASERALIEALPDCITWLRMIDDADRADIQRVLAPINQGQALDVQHFADPQTIAALETPAELDRYTFLVAGCVGEFWTSVCFRHLARFARRPQEEMSSLGVRYGKGLQLINILRDIGADLQAGRCYLPAEQLRALGVAPEEIRANPRAIEPLLREWQDAAAAGLAAGLEYSSAIVPWRVRLATTLPALIGARTLALLRRAGADAVATRIKVPRAEIRRILLTTAATFASRRSLAKQFRTLSADG